MYKLFNDTNQRRVVKPHIFQLAMLLADYREIFISTGQGSGKTSFTPIWISFQQSLRPEEEIIFSEPTAGMLERVGIPKYLEFVKDTYFEGRFTNKKMGVYENDFGKIYFVSAEAPEHIQGVHAIAAVMDEAGQCSRVAYDIIRSRLNQKNGKLLAVTNPYRRKDPWIFRDIYKRWKNQDPEVLFLNYPSIVNPAFDLSRFEKDKKILASYDFDFQYMGEYNKPQGLIYDIDNAIKLVDIQEGEAYAGADFGMGDPTVLLIGILDRTGLHLVDEYYRANIAPSEHALIWANKIKTYKIRTIFYKAGDLVYKVEIDKVLKEKGINVEWKSVNPDIREGIKIVDRMLREGRLTLNPSLSNTLNEANGYVYDGDEPIQKDDHAMEALKYLCRGVEKRVYKVVEEMKPNIELSPLAEMIKNHFEGLFKKKEKKWIQYL